jgi:hypothetical protein
MGVALSVNFVPAPKEEVQIVVGEEQLNEGG